MLILVSFLLLSTTGNAQSLLQNLNVAAAVDIVAPTSFDESEDNKVGVRSAELMFYAPIDHIFDGVLNVAGHDDEGEFHFELHEGYIGSSKLIPQSRFRIGKFFLNVGRLNTFHQHDWPFIAAPKVHREFFNPGAHSAIEAEGAADTGIEYSWILPTDRYFDITVGVTNGYCFGHCHDEGERPPYPLHYIHPTTFFDWGTGRGILLGASYLGRKDSSDVKTDLFGIDLTYKNREGRKLKWLVQSEVYYQMQSAPAMETSKKAGLYIYPQYGINENISFGVRLDGFSHLNLEFQSNGESREDFDYAFAPTLTYKPSEFSALRLAYSHEVDTTQGVSDVTDRQIQMQFLFILGAHPAHEF
jgi:hypothetical protein